MTALITGLLVEVAPLLVHLGEKPPPEPEDVKAGWTAFALFVLMIVTVGLLGWSLAKHLRKAQANQDAGMFGSDDPAVGLPVDRAGAEPEPRQAP